MSNIAIQFENVGKLYQLGTVGTGSMAHDLNRWWQTRILRREDPYLKIGETNDRSKKGTSDFVWALRDITFDVEQGDVVGIIGKNGAGKSTLLKLLSRVTAPTTGMIRASGRIASLLEVGTGFHPEMTGRQNIYMNGSIMGMTRHEITSKLDEIVDFAGVERYLDTPTKRYSSGMMVRLGFAVAAFLEPEILVVDEVLAVGDAEFQKKAIGKMQDVASGQGRTVLFVSHNMAAVRSLCKSGIVLDNGMISYDGDVNSAIDKYNCNCDISANTKILDNIINKKNFIDVFSITINGSDSHDIYLPANQETLVVEVKGNTKERLLCNLKVIFKTSTSVPVASSVDGKCNDETMTINPGDFSIVKNIQMPKYLGKGVYKVDIGLFQPAIQDFFFAGDCATLTCEGNALPFCRPIVLEREGFLSLETNTKIEQ